MSFRRTISLGVKTGLVDNLISALSIVPGAALLITPTCHLIKNPNAVLDNNYDLADLATDECDFTGYAADALGSLLGPINTAGGERGRHAEVDFLCSAGIPNQIAYGYVIDKGDATNLYFWETFAEPVPFATPGDFLSLDVVIALPLLLRGD